MKSFSLSILDQLGSSKEFEFVCEDREALQSHIVAEGWVVLKIRENRLRKLYLQGEDLILFCQHLQLMLEAGLAVQDAVDALADEGESAQLASVCRSVSGRIEKGETLSNSLNLCRIDSFCLAMIKTGEQTGQLPDLLGRAAIHLQWRDELRRKILSSLSYPALIILVLCLVVPLLFVYLVPQLVGFLDGMDAALPWYTKALIATADFVQNHGMKFLLVSGLIFGCLVFLWLSSASVRTKLDQWLLKIPLLGRLSMQLNTAQLSEQLGIMYSAGIPVAQALPLVSRSLKNRYLRVRLQAVSESLNHGETLHRALSTQRFSSMLLRLVSVGEVSGRLDRTLAQAAVFYSRQAHRRADNLAAVIGPVALLIAGLVLVWLIAALILPLYEGLFSLGTGL